MEDAITDLHGLISSSRRVAQRVLTIGENRLVLLVIEMQEERDRLLRLIFLALAMAVLVLLAGLTCTALLVLVVWPYAPLSALGGLTVVYALAAWLLWRRMQSMMQGWTAFASTLEHLHKDKAMLDKVLS